MEILILIQLLLSIVLLLPLKDDRGPYKTFPSMTLSLIGINVGIFLYTNFIMDRQFGPLVSAQLYQQALLVPAFVVRGTGLPALNILLSCFMHASWSHLLGNMFFLWFFGRKVEDRLGAFKFGMFYLVCLFASSIGSVLWAVSLPIDQGRIPSLGASGAIMGVMGGYLFMYQNELIRTMPMLFGVIPIPIFPRIPAWSYILLQILKDVSTSLLEQQAEARGFIFSLVGSIAHLSGAITGLLIIMLFLPAAFWTYRYRPDEKLPSVLPPKSWG